MVKKSIREPDCFHQKSVFMSLKAESPVRVIYFRGLNHLLQVVILLYLVENALLLKELPKGGFLNLLYPMTQFP